jgi:hypothetical protein
MSDQTKPIPTGRIVEIGDLKTVDTDSEKRRVWNVRRAILIQFETEEEVKQALDARSAKFTWWGT